MQAVLDVVDVAVVIVNYSSAEKVLALLADVGASRPHPCEVVIVDNGDVPFGTSTSEFPFEVTVIRTTNRGFGAAVNEGVLQCRAGALCVSNPDVRLQTPEIFGKLHRELQQMGVGIVAPEVLGTNGQAAAEVGTDLPSLRSSLTMAWRQRRGTSTGANPGYVDSVTGAFLMISRATWTQLNGFDETYFMYFEDADLCARVRRLGLRILILAGVTVEHEIGGTPASWAQRRGWYEASRKHYFDSWRPRYEGLVVAALGLISQRRNRDAAMVHQP